MLIILDGCFSPPIYINLPDSADVTYNSIHAHTVSTCGLDLNQFSIYHNDNLITNHSLFNLSPINGSFCVLRAQSRINGGKGGFGSMLKAIGAQIERTTNHEACRDLNGRRMRDIHAEKALRKWNKNRWKRAAEKEKRLAEKREKRWSEAAPPKFHNTRYLNELSANSENVDAALQHAQSSMGKKRIRLNSNCSSGKIASKKLRLVYKNFYEDGISDSESNSDADINLTYYGKICYLSNKSHSSCSSTSLATYNSSTTTTITNTATTTNPITTTTTTTTNPITTTTTTTTTTNPITTSTNTTNPITTTNTTNTTTTTTDNDDDSKSACTNSNSICDLKSAEVSSQSFTPSRHEESDNSSVDIIPEYLPISDSTTTNNIIDAITPLSKDHSDSNSSPEVATPIDINSIVIRQSLEELSLAQLKATLQHLGLKCGGTLIERVDRLWLYKTTPKDKLPSNIFAGKSNPRQKK